jgi:hypothetical protein
MIIGIIGKARAGKDTFGLMLAEELFKLTRQRYVLMAYAHELKIRVQKDFDLSYDQLWGDDKEKQDLRYAKSLKGFSSNPTDYWCPREILQSYGEFYRSINYNFWADHLFEIIDDKEYKRVIITDVRHINEADPVIDRKGILIKIIRGIDNDIHGQEHISEVALDDYNIELVIENNGTLKDLKSAAKEVAKKLIEEKK